MMKKQKQDKPGAILDRAIRFDNKLGPSVKALASKGRGKIQAQRAAKKLGKPLAKGGK